MKKYNKKELLEFLIKNKGKEYKMTIVLHHYYYKKEEGTICDGLIKAVEEKYDDYLQLKCHIDGSPLPRVIKGCELK